MHVKKYNAHMLCYFLSVYVIALREKVCGMKIAKDIPSIMSISRTSMSDELMVSPINDVPKYIMLCTTNARVLLNYNYIIF